MHLGQFCYLYNAQMLLLSPVEISKGKYGTKVVAGGQECHKHDTKLSPGAVKRGTNILSELGLQKRLKQLWVSGNIANSKVSRH